MNELKPKATREENKTIRGNIRECQRILGRICVLREPFLHETFYPLLGHLDELTTLMNDEVNFKKEKYEEFKNKVIAQRDQINTTYLFSVKKDLRLLEKQLDEFDRLYDAEIKEKDNIKNV